MTTGTVVAFDDHKGYGVVRAIGDEADGAGDGPDYFFHCTQLVDGSRTIAVGTEVSFEVAPGRLGQWEAAGVAAVAAVAQPR